MDLANQSGFSIRNEKFMKVPLRVSKKCNIILGGGIHYIGYKLTFFSFFL